MKHINGKFESAKFESRRSDFYEYRNYLQEQKLDISDLLEHFPAYVGHIEVDPISWTRDPYL